LHRFLARRTDAPFNKVILRRLFRSKINRPPLSLSRISKAVASTPNFSDRIIVLFGIVTDDVRLQEVPKLTIAALRFTRGAKVRILIAGGDVLTLDRLALRAPTSTANILSRGKATSQKAAKHLGTGPHKYCKLLTQQDSGVVN
ncbi:ribosomal protein L18e, partial [Schizopora paradoxa]